MPEQFLEQGNEKRIDLEKNQPKITRGKSALKDRDRDLILIPNSQRGRWR